MNTDLIGYIKKIGIRFNVDKILLFGSRARGDNNETSDFDFAVFGTLSSQDKSSIAYELKFNSPTLTKIDIVFFSDCKNEELKNNILKDGKIIYDKNGN